MASETFDEVDNFPDPEAKRRYDQLVGLDEVKLLLTKESRLLINPSLLDQWSERHYKKKIRLIDIFKRKPSLFIFAGDVGTGKSSLAETFGDTLARGEKISVLLYRLSLKSRGNGMVGDMTNLISAAFTEVHGEAKRAAGGKKPSTAYILLIDEADALAQSRELDQMHHEDKAGVNALIRGIDSISTSRLPVIIVMCTNRLSALDPAVRRRAASIFEFKRPSDEQREMMFTSAFEDTGITAKELSSLVKATGPAVGIDYGFTYSDIMQRMLPGILLNAFPDDIIDFSKAIAFTKQLTPTPPFKEN